jgi:mannose-6-phosphate isomerase-like protein (cupin superfamily)
MSGPTARVTAAENERNLLGFRREQLAEGVQVAHVAARRGESSLVHHHTRTRDTFYVLSGQLTITLHLPPGAIPSDCYNSLCSAEPIISYGDAGEQTHRVRLGPGDVLVIEPGVVHCASNLHDAVCRFLCIEGVGDYDFIQDDLR